METQKCIGINKNRGQGHYNDPNVSFLDAVTTVDVFTLHMRYNFSKVLLYIYMINIIVSFRENKQKLSVIGVFTSRLFAP